MTCNELPPVLRVLVESRCAWLTEFEIAYALNSDADDASAEVQRLIERGYVTRHMLTSGDLVVTFSQEGAAQFGYSLTERNAKSFYRWAPTADCPERARRPRKNRGPDPAAQVVDPSPGPPELAMLREDDVARPIVILMGHGLWQWDERRGKSERRPETTCRECIKGGKRRKVLKAICKCGRGLRRRPKLTVCPACKGKPLSRWTYCLRCYRWGWDEVFRPKLAERRA